MDTSNQPNFFDTAKTEGIPVESDESYAAADYEEDELLDYEAILGIDAAIPLEDELIEIEESGVLEKLAQEEAEKGGELLSDEEMLRLFKQRDEGGKAAGDAIAEIYARNQWVVKSVVARYRRKDSWLEFDDLVLEGDIGLLTAIRRYDAGKAAKFSTFAYGTVRGRVLRAQGKDPRVVKPFTKLTKELLDLMDDFYEEHHRDYLDNRELLDFAKDLTKENGTPVWPPERLKLAALKLRQNSPASSLDAPLDGGGDGEDGGEDELKQGDLLAGSPEKAADDDKVEKERIAKIEEAIDEADLDDKIAVLLKSFLKNPAGIYDDEEVAKKLGHPTEAEISKLLRKGLENQRLKEALRKKGLIEEE